MKIKSLLTLVMCFVCLSMSAAWDGTVASSYAGGDGTKDNPYQIATCEQFAFLAKNVNSTENYSRGKYFKQTADLVFNNNVLATANATLKGGKAFTISPTVGSFTNESNYVAFQGTYDGDGHVISGLYYFDGGNAFTIFRAIDGATMKNMTIKDSYIYAGNSLGFIAANVFDSNIINCQVIGCEIDSWSSTEGGICGYTYRTCKIQNCYTNVTFNVKNNCGGIVGKASNNLANFTNDVLIENCITNCSMTYSKSDKKAGVAYYLYGNATLKDCWYATSCDCVYGNNSWDEGKSTVDNCNSYSDVATAVAAANAKAANIPGACRFNADGTLDYSTKTAEEGSYDVNNRATDPVPADANMHVALNNGSVTLSWTPSADKATVKQNIYIGYDKDAVAAMTTPTATLGTQTSYTVSDIDILKTYYWRVDRVDAAGNAAPGDVWSFRGAHLAFPGAEGYGRTAHGGRGGNVVYVTNLNNKGEGSLRWALTNGSGPRTVMFKVGGIIDMNWETCKVDEYVTIAAQTAPGKGILVFHSDIGLGQDDICRFLRARRGLGNINPTTGLSDETGNAMGMNGDNSIMDHVSLAWGTDETFSSRNAKDITFQRCMIAEALGMAYHRNYTTTTNHGYAATIGGDIGTFSHNLLANCMGRNWSMGGGAAADGSYAGRLDMFNNVCYNWGGRATDGGAMEVNFIGNYYKVGPASLKTSVQKKLFLLQIEGNLKGQQQAYVSGNVREEYNGTIVQDKEGNTYEAQITSSRTTPVTWDMLVSTPFFGGEHYATVEKAEDAYKSVVSDFGANQPCVDEHDKRIQQETINRTYTYTGSRSGIYGQIDNEKDITATSTGIEIYEETSWGDDYDSDENGLPQWWEKITGETNPNRFTSTGYTAIEDYINFLAQPHISLANGKQTTINLTDLFAGYTNSPSFSISGANTSLVDASVSGNTLTVKALGSNAITSLTMNVVDAEGSSYQRTLNIALSDVVLGVKESLAASDIASCEVYTTGGVKVGTSLNGLTSGLYVVKVIDKNGNKRNAKVVVR